MEFGTLLILAVLVAGLVFVMRGRKRETPQQSEQEIDPKSDRQALISQKSGMPYHPMLEHFVPGIHITKAEGKQLPSAATISNFESEMGWTLPKAYREFIMKYGAVYFRVTDDIWPESDIGAVGPFWSFNYGFIIYGIADGVPDWLNIRTKYNQLKEEFPNLPFFMPIHRLVAGDETYVGFDKNGTLVTALQHENKLEPLDVDFDTFVASEARDLKIRMKGRKGYNRTGKWPEIH